MNHKSVQQKTVKDIGYTIESVPAGGLNLTVVPVVPEEEPNAPIVLPKDDDPNNPVPVDGAACAVCCPKSEVVWVGWV